jgi:hypothetical protein
MSQHSELEVRKTVLIQQVEAAQRAAQTSATESDARLNALTEDSPARIAALGDASYASGKVWAYQKALQLIHEWL